MLNIRRFVKGVDEPGWVEVLNAAYEEYESWWRGATVEEMRDREKRRGFGFEFDFEGRFIAELDGSPVGVLYVRVEELRGEKMGFIRSFGVIPEFRGRGVEAKLVESVLNELEKHGVNLVQTWTGCRRTDRIQVLEALGFKPVYRTLDMEVSLASIPSGIGENLEMSVRLLRKDVDDDVSMLNWLSNECFRGHRDYRPKTIEGTRDFLFNDPELNVHDFLFAVLDRKDVGYVGVGIDERYNVRRGVKRGRISGIGVLEPYRKKGVGTRLVLQGLEALKAIGMTKVMVDTEDFNTKAVRLYEKVGFEVVQDYVTHEKSMS